MPLSPIASAANRPFNPKILEQLVCPVCFGRLNLTGADLGIQCSACKRIYPVKDGIPILIPANPVSRPAKNDPD